MSASNNTYSNDVCKKRQPAYYHHPGTEPMKWKTVGQILDEAAEKYPERDALIVHHERISLNFLQVKQQAEQLGASFLKLGLKPGDRLGLLGVNTSHWYISLLAAAKAGIITVLLNPASRPQELNSALKRVGVKGLVTDHKFKTQDYPGILAELAPGMSSAPHGQPLSCPQLPKLSFVIVATEQRLPGCYRFKDIMCLANDKEMIRAAEEKIQPDDPLFIMFSSGTTGLPKAAVLSHFGQINNSYNIAKRSGFFEKFATLCLQVPFFHVFGTTAGIVSGLHSFLTLLLPGPVFTKEFTIEALKTYKVTSIFGTPTMFIDLYDGLAALLPSSPELQEGCANVDFIGSGASYIPPELIKSTSEVFPHADFVTALGMTEAGACCFLTFRDDTFENKCTVGCVLDHSEVRVVDDEGKTVPFGTPGEAWYRSNYQLLEYWGDEGRMKETKTKAGWFKSGDIIILREDGYAIVKGRKKDIIIRGGENIFPQETENLLLQHPDILKAEVYGVADERLGEEVAVSIILRPSSTLTETNIKDFCKEKISHFKIPKYIRFVEQFPVTTTGKVKKCVLREMLEKELKIQN